jgi:hypothetical protein
MMRVDIDQEDILVVQGSMDNDQAPFEIFD